MYISGKDWRVWVLSAQLQWSVLDVNVYQLVDYFVH